jgi:hypothetical protein
VPRLILAGVLALTALSLAPAADATCDLHCHVAAVCGSESECFGVQRCYYWSDQPTCVYP